MSGPRPDDRRICDDDPTIADDTMLYRRVPPIHVVADQNLGGMRLSSAAFADDKDGDPMSVALGDTLASLGRAPSTVLDGHAGFGLVEFPAGAARKQQQAICRTPVDEEPAHGSVAGPKPRRVKRAIRDSSAWTVFPPGMQVV